MLHVALAKRRGDFVLNVQFDAPTPGVVAIFGRSGCGKSTVVNLLAGLLDADSGAVRLDETLLIDTAQGIALAPERRRVGYVFQDARLFPHLRVAANLSYAAKRAMAPHYIGLDAVVDLLDLRGLLRRRTHELSGGERQRVAIGRALLTQPQLLLLDEPLAALDVARREEVLPYLETLRDRLSVPMVYVSHRFDEVLRLATHLVLMEAGSVVAQGELGAMSLDPHLRALVGYDEVGAIMHGVVLGTDETDHLMRVRVGHGELKVAAAGLAAGTTLRVQLLARDVIVSTVPPAHLSVRNSLAAVITHVVGDDAYSDLITLDIGATPIMARITKAATRDLKLRPGLPAWALVKAVSLRGHAFPTPAASATPAVSPTSAASPGA